MKIRWVSVSCVGEVEAKRPSMGGAETECALRIMIKTVTCEFVWKSLKFVAGDVGRLRVTRSSM